MSLRLQEHSLRSLCRSVCGIYWRNSSNSWLLVDTTALLLFLGTVAAATGLLALSNPASLRSTKKPGFALGLLTCLLSSFIFDTWLMTLAASILCTLLYLAVQVDTRNIRTSTGSHVHHNHQHHAPQPTGSAVTRFLLKRTTEWPLLHSILSEKESYVSQV